MKDGHQRHGGGCNTAVLARKMTPAPRRGCQHRGAGMKNGHRRHGGGCNTAVLARKMAPAPQRGRQHRGAGMKNGHRRRTSNAAPNVAPKSALNSLLDSAPNSGANLAPNSAPNSAPSSASNSAPKSVPINSLPFNILREMGIPPPPDERPGAGQWRSRRPSQDGTPSQDELQGSYRAQNKSIWSKKCQRICW